MARIGILTGGGNCPGLNAVIRAIVRKGVNAHGHEFFGFTSGWAGVLAGEGRPLDLAGGGDARDPAPRRHDPRHLANQPLQGGRSRRRGSPGRHGEAAGVEMLIPIGGEDTLGVAGKLADAGVPVVGVPKTIDNDLAGTDFTFGFQTAVQIATDAIDRLHTTAESHDR